MENNRFQSLIENIPGAAYTCAMDEYWTMEYISPHIEQMSGYCPSDFIYNKVRSYSSLIYDKDEAMVEQVVLKAVESKQPYSINYRIVDSNNNIHWVFEEGRAKYDDQGNAMWLDGIIFDVSFSKINEQLESGSFKVLESLARGDDIKKVLEQLVLHVEGIWPGMICSILVLDDSGEHLREGAAPGLPDYYNEAIDGLKIGAGVGSCGTAAFTKEPCIVADVTTHPYWQSFLPLTERAGLKACWSYPITSGDGRVLGTFACYYKDKKEPTELELSSIKKAQYVAGISIQRHNEEKEIIIAKEKAEKASQAKSEFLSRMSHELRTPLNAVMGFSQLAMYDEDLGSENKSNIEEIYKAGDHLLTLVNDILDLSRIETKKLEFAFEEVNINDVISESLSIVGELAEIKNIAMKFVASESVEQVWVDRSRLKQVMVNLLSNSIKYNHENGSVNVLVEMRQPEKVRVSVADTGIGISEEKMQRLFVPFERLSENRYDIEGVGIGLVISKELTEKMDGILGVESREDVGSTFWIELPAK